MESLVVLTPRDNLSEPSQIGGVEIDAGHVLGSWKGIRRRQQETSLAAGRFNDRLRLRATAFQESHDATGELVRRLEIAVLDFGSCGRRFFLIAIHRYESDFGGRITRPAGGCHCLGQCEPERTFQLVEAGNRLIVEALSWPAAELCHPPTDGEHSMGEVYPPDTGFVDAVSFAWNPISWNVLLRSHCLRQWHTKKTRLSLLLAARHFAWERKRFRGGKREP
jgi:hypothetical protein